MTGDFIGFGIYTSYEEPEQKTKTHVLHLCMEKQDLDLYFTHKNKENDWEVMAVEFVPAEKQDPIDTASETAEEQMIAADRSNQYTETAVQVGQEPYLLDGILTLPNGADASNKVPGVVLVQGSGPSDMNETIGQTKLFADIAALFAKKGIATLRYNKRTYTYGEQMAAENPYITVEEETIQDAISAGKMLAANPAIDTKQVILLGHSMGAMLAPRIATEAGGVFTAMVLVAGTPLSLLDIMLAQNKAALAKLPVDQQADAKAQVDTLSDQIKALKAAKNADAAKQITIAGVNGYYFWEMMQYDTIKQIRKLRLPVYIVQGNDDFQISLENGVEAYEDELTANAAYADFHIFRKLNHLLMIYHGPAEAVDTVAEYDTPATLDTVAGRNLADWILALGQTDDEE
jgi:dipeptidyl aminopeptidase/acylaminoacyl peptidase